MAGNNVTTTGIVSKSGTLGQVHHMFSRILKLLNFDFFTKFYLFCFSPRKELFIGIEKAYTILCNPLKIEKKENNFRRFVNSEFVKNM